MPPSTAVPAITKKPTSSPDADSAIVVQKYGGSSVADTDRIKLVAERIARTRAEGKKVCVVVSAMGKTTDDLLARARELSPAPPRRELDMLLSCGERASMALLSMAVSELGYEAISFTGSQCGIMTNDRHSSARIVEVRPFRVKDELDRGRVVIVAGFQGVSYKREITTLGRGGSDTTAVALAAALGAEYCEICSDVDGVYDADPRIVDAAELLDAISHDTMIALAAHGARVLHRDAVLFAKNSGVALWARATAGSGDRGTRIDVPDAIENPDPPAVTSRAALLSATSSDGAALLSVLSEHNVELVHCGRASGATTVHAAPDDVPDWDKVRAALSERLGDAVSFDDDRGSVTLVSADVELPATIATALAAASAVGTPVLDYVTSPLALTLFCGRADVNTLCRAVYDAFSPGE